MPDKQPPDMAALLKKVFDTIKPDLRGHYRIVRKGRVVKAYPSGGSYYADVQPLTNDESADPKEPVIPQVEIPVLWGGNGRGVVCPPAPGTIVDIEYMDGDPNFPKISAVRWEGQSAPAAAVGEFVIQHGPGVKAYFGADGKFHVEAPEITMTAATVKITGNVEITGALTTTGPITAGGGVSANAGATVTGSLDVIGDISATGTNPNHHTH